MIKLIEPIASVNNFQTSHIFQLGQFHDVLDKQIAHNSVTSLFTRLLCDERSHHDFSNNKHIE